MDVQAQTIGSALPASEREEHFADTAPVSPRKTPEQRTRGRARHLLITTEAMVAEKPKKETPLPAMPPGGGMDY
jgi:hypothetical protein